VLNRGGSRVWKGVGVHFVEKVEDKKKKKKRSRVGEGSSNTTIKLKNLIIIPIYSFTGKLHCLINTATALLELLTDCSIRVSRSFMTKGWGGGGHVPPMPPSGSAPAEGP